MGTVPPLHRFSHEAMATVFETVITGEAGEYARQVSQEIFREIDHLEAVFSRFDPTSDVARMSRLRPGDRLPVTAEAFECLLIASRVHAETNGAFDITVGSLIDCLRDESGVPCRSSASDLEAARTRVGMNRLVLRGRPVDESGGESGITAPPFSVGIAEVPDDSGKTGVAVDLGGIGKGYALDRSREILDDWGVGSALIHGGSSTALAVGSGGEAAGCPEGTQGWPVRVGAEWGSAAGLERVLLQDKAVSGSGTEVKGGHIVDPRTGKVVEHHAATWVVAPSGALADALSTAFMVMSTEEVEVYCGAHPEVSALVVAVTRTGHNVRVFGKWKWLR